MLQRSRRYGSLTAGDLPGTLQRSCREAQVTFLKAHEEAVRAYGEGDEAYRAAYTVLKQTFEKCGDHWIAKAESAA
ncbi:MAG TPA: ChaB family protein [Streptosporangiaceae bacterium]|nr:ChaB family protein [Streptosporangiaceae bacterium]